MVVCFLSLQKETGVYRCHGVVQSIVRHLRGKHEGVDWRIGILDGVLSFLPLFQNRYSRESPVASEGPIAYIIKLAFTIY